jgi:hypothetical protein
VHHAVLAAPEVEVRPLEGDHLAPALASIGSQADRDIEADVEIAGRSEEQVQVRPVVELPIGRRTRRSSILQGSRSIAFQATADLSRVERTCPEAGGA